MTAPSIAKDPDMENDASAQPVEPTTNVVQGLQLQPDDQQAWQRLYARYQPRVFAWCRQKHLSESDADEVTGDVLVRMFQYLKSFDRTKGPFQAWMRTMCQHAVFDFRRKTGQQGLARGGEEVLRVIEAVPAADWFREFEEAEVWRLAMDRVCARSDAEEWAVFEARHIQGQGAAEVAQHLQVSITKVYSHTAKIKTQLQAEVALLSRNAPEV